MTTIKAIETTYKGYRFRSRLEARWAVFFDALGVKWQYEPEGFELSDGTRYLPDFYINAQDSYVPGSPGYGPWLEVKGTKPDSVEIEKMRQLCEQACSYGLIVWGDPGEGNVLHFHKEGHCEGETHQIEMLYWLGVGAYLNSDDGFQRFYDASTAAKSARFEYGQSGARP